MRRPPGRGITDLVERLLTVAEVYAPVERDQSVVFDRIESAREAAIDRGPAALSPKNLVFPRCEMLLSSSTRGDESGRAPDPGPGGPRVLFGVRPCDARAIALLDRILGGGEKTDSYYIRRRESLVVISIGCTESLETCFCETTGGGPRSTEGSDILLEDLGDRCEASIITEKGVWLAGQIGLEHDPAGARTPRGPAPPAGPAADLAELKKRLDRSFEDQCWRDIALKCIGCGVCTFLCPACHCFDVIDEETAGVRVRSRIWDSCQFPAFTEQASGYNPRPSAAERFRQRVMHKFSYCIERYGMPGCVGCGRCVSRCPVNLDIRTVTASFLGDGGEP
ncbi:4Fe-4S ferredoxin [Candidatus Fermentibacteria bacterium]|nr:4Fe-4S ferredoxin [Candidatus Fermentibacteria bacterium]